MLRREADKLVLGKEAKDDFAAALAYHQEAIRLKPKDAMAHYRLGVTLRSKGDLGPAVTAFRKALELDGNLAVAHNGLGKALSEQGAHDEAVACLKQAVRRYPRLPRFLGDLAHALAGKGDLKEALTAYRQALQLDPQNAEFRCQLGLLLTEKGEYDAGMTALREAIRLQPDFAEAYHHLGAALQHEGQLAEALAAFRRGHELGSRDPNWRFPSAESVKRCERLVGLEKQLPAVLAGKDKPDAAGLLDFAELCRSKRLFGTASRLSEAAFAAQPALTERGEPTHRYLAACSAALAGCGQGEEATKLDVKERARWRKQALKWLEADLVLWTKRMESGPPQDRKTVAARLQHWQRNQDLAGIRDAALLAKLPPDEQEACMRLWAEVEAVLQKAQGKTSEKAPE
jgi:tetratricopeptide (TPR) repeat protein